VKLPRDLSGDALAARLANLGYAITRQRGDHLRLTTSQGGEHHVTIPRHDPLKVGTLSGILSDVGAHFGLSREELLNRLI
jgi:predicted RNA binding protein YcfA (HicA-like mRNA interferase family)